MRPPLFSIHAFTQNTKACTINFRTEPEPRSHLAPSWRAQLLRRGKESDSENAPRVCVPFRAAQCAERCATASTLHTHMRNENNRVKFFIGTQSIDDTRDHCTAHSNSSYRHMCTDPPPRPKLATPRLLHLLLLCSLAREVQDAGPRENPSVGRHALSCNTNAYLRRIIIYTCMLALARVTSVAPRPFRAHRPREVQSAFAAA